jgi:DNA-binding response OmpR family regulator
MQRIDSILVADDEPMIGDLIAEILTDEGYVAYSAPDGAAVLAAVARHPPALLLLDAGWSGIASAELIAQVRSASLAALPMVVMTTVPDAAASLLIPGSFECLAKPFDLDDLLACVARYVRPAPAADQPAALSDSSGVALFWPRRQRIGGDL